MNVHERFSSYEGGKCWQAHVADQNKKEDLQIAGMTEQEAAGLRVSDFDFDFIGACEGM